MAAAANKPVAIHYALVLFVVLSMVLGITNYMSIKEFNDRTAKMTELTDENQKKQAAIGKASDQIEALKKLIGVKFTEVDGGAGNPQNQATVLTAA